MPMLLDRTGETPERWSVLRDGASLPEAGALIVPVERLDEAAAKGPGLRLGVTIPNDATLDPLRSHLARLELVRIVFPSFADGRGFSLARRVRGIGFTGRLRAAGPVIADQFGYLLACGFDEVEVADAVAARQPAEQWMAALNRISRFYQPRPGSPAIAVARRAAVRRAAAG